MSRNTWDDLADQYAANLHISVDDVHFGVGIPGNKQLRLIPAMSGTAIDVGCGAGENLVALARLGYKVTGVDSSTRQLEHARKTLATQDVRAALVVADLDDFGVAVPREETYDLFLCVGAAHFARDIHNFLRSCTSHARIGSRVVLSLPHPIDMVVTATDVPPRAIIFDNYFPAENRIVGARYWAKFAGHIPIADDLIEYVHRPSDVVAAMIELGWRVNGLWEPQQQDDTAPCRYRAPDPWCVSDMYKRVPQYLIIGGTYEG
jgi:2-polyprenyl-3-methyl-5-hydroxy-6-metoxy-1,4-benzoquinol methylase